MSILEGRFGIALPGRELMRNVQHVRRLRLAVRQVTLEWDVKLQAGGRFSSSEILLEATLGKCNTMASNYNERVFSDIVGTSMILSFRSIADFPRLTTCST